MTGFLTGIHSFLFNRSGARGAAVPLCQQKIQKITFRFNMFVQEMHVFTNTAHTALYFHDISHQ